ncbi:MAG: NAD-dependent epimerase/dehydratase family protein [Planctomycetota bacterium]
MVNSTLTDAIQNVLGETPRRILVTGGTGFIGSRVALAFSQSGHTVTTTGRNRYLAPPGIGFRRADLRDAEQAIELCRGQDVVIHAAAEASIGKTYRQLEPINVIGTENVIQGCLQHNVQRLVHISSTAVLFEARDDLNIDDARNLPARFFNGYAESKAVAEQRVIEACRQRLNGFIIRARAVYGPGDNSLVPRILKAHDRGSLKQIGSGENLTDLTHIDNLIYAVALAIVKGTTGGICTITGGEPVKIWDVVRQILSAHGRSHRLKRVPYRLAYTIASINEWYCRWFAKQEPTLTRYSVGLLGRSQTFSPVAAEHHLGYQPLVDQQQSIQETLVSFSAKVETNAKQWVKLRLFSTGYTTNREMAAEAEGAWGKKIRFHAMIALIEHPEHGVTLFDTGYTQRFFDATKNWPYSIYAKITPALTPEQHSAVAILQRLGIHQTDVQRIIISHFHADHTGGLLDFPDADLISTREAFDSVGRSDGYHTGFRAVRSAFLPQLMPRRDSQRWCLLDQFHDPGIGPFVRTHDLFHDGSVRLIKMPGHADGQMGALVQVAENRRVLLVADATLTRKTIEQDLPLTRPIKWLAADARAAETTRKQLVSFHRQFPDVEIIPTHCPAVACEHRFDETLDASAE